jgi:hypothetical protein
MWHFSEVFSVGMPAVIVLLPRVLIFSAHGV